MQELIPDYDEMSAQYSAYNFPEQSDNEVVTRIVADISNKIRTDVIR